jgi:hypothetical protein
MNGETGNSGRPTKPNLCTARAQLTMCPHCVVVAATLQGGNLCTAVTRGRNRGHTENPAQHAGRVLVSTWPRKHNPVYMCLCVAFGVLLPVVSNAPQRVEIQGLSANDDSNKQKYPLEMVRSLFGSCQHQSSNIAVSALLPDCPGQSRQPGMKERAMVSLIDQMSPQEHFQLLFHQCTLGGGGC